MIRIFLAIGVAALLVGCSGGGTETVATAPAATSSSVAPVSAAASSTFRWKAIAAAGDDSIPVFDNAVDRFASLMVERDVVNLRRFTSTAAQVAADRPVATVANMNDALAGFRPGPGEACLVFLTSHGSRNGLLLRQDLDQEQRLTPARFGRMLDEDCGQAPTVAIVSGCFSGIFIGSVTAAANRIILTAARDDRPSFGCSADETYTYFDACLFDAWPQSKTWEDLVRRTDACVSAKEDALNFMHSQPQAFFGAQMRNVALP